MIMPIIKSKALLKALSFPVPDGMDLNQLVQDMVDTAEHHDAEGLAGVQIGASLRVIVIALSATKPRHYVCLVNPVITKSSGILTTELEGCLSIPGAKWKVPRALSIEVSYTAFNTGKAHVQKLQGRLARVVQHEVDHLDGILVTDKAVTIQ
jgi:peptide deformylase